MALMLEGSFIHYQMPAYKSFASSSSKYPVSKSISERGISFPTFNNSLRLDSIINRIKKFKDIKI